MKFKTEKTQLLEAIQTVEDIIPTKSTLPILSNILFKVENSKLRLITTDLEIGISKTISVNVENEGAITLPARKISSIVKELPDEDVEFVVKKNNLTIIKSGNCVLKLIGIDSDEFPSLPKIEECENIKIDKALLKKVLKMTSFAISKDETRYVLNGLLFNIDTKKLFLVATDGRRLALKKEDLDVKKNYNLRVIIPYKAIQIIEKLLDEEGSVDLDIGENQIMFSSGNTLIISRLIEGDFPDYNQVIPKENNIKFLVNKDSMLNALKRASLLTTTDSLGVRLDITKESMVISKNTPEIGEIKEKIDGTYNGKEMTIGFNPVYLLDVLKVFPEDMVSIEMTHPEKPAVLRINDEYIYLVLPMQLS